MATMAQWGSIKFSVSSSKVFSFNNMKRSYSGRWASHNIIGKRPKMEFQGPDLDEITIEVILDAEMGVTPRSVMNDFRSAAKSGKVGYFYVGGSKVAVNKFYIEKGTENWNEIWNKGELVRATAQLTFKEYT
ncbi:MAG: phage tail protein [Clostridiales bacterium]|nr:phage tail protein [Clostridiales bacterium]